MGEWPLHTVTVLRLFLVVFGLVLGLVFVVSEHRYGLRGV
jgi:hypothetical protein